MQRLKNWFNHQRQLHDQTDGKSPWTAWLSALRKPMDPPPKRIPCWKYYMAHSKYADKVSMAFDEKWAAADLEPKHQINFRCKVAQELFESEDKEVQEELQKEMEEKHLELVKSH